MKKKRRGSLVWSMKCCVSTPDPSQSWERSEGAGGGSCLTFYFSVALNDIHSGSSVQRKLR